MLKYFSFLLPKNKTDKSLDISSDNIINSYVDDKRLIHAEAKIERAKLYGKIQVGARSWISDAILVGGEIRIGSNTSINPYVSMYAELNPIFIGNFCSIASNVVFQEYNHHITSCSTYFMNFRIFEENWHKDIESRGAIEIGNDVWIGAQAIILSGVKIGNGAVIGANTVVTTDIPPFAIAVGSPAKVIKYRFSEEIIESLEKTKWWDWEIEKIKANKGLFFGELNLEKIKNIV